MPQQKKEERTKDISEGYTPRRGGTAIERGYTPTRNPSGINNGYVPTQKQESTTEAPAVKPGTKL